MKLKIIAPILAVMLLAGGLTYGKDSPEKKREKSRKMAAQTLNPDS